MSNGPFRDASLFYASCVPSGGRYQLQCSSRLLLHSSFLDLAIVTAFCLNFLPNLIQCLQSVQNVATRLIFRILRSEHITPVFINLHWLRVSERISFKLAVLTYHRSIHGISPSYLQSCFTRVADMTSRRRLWSSAFHRLEAPPVCLSTDGKRAFPVAGANMWNDLLFLVTSAQSLAVFRQCLKTFLFSRSYPDIVSPRLLAEPWRLEEGAREQVGMRVNAVCLQQFRQFIQLVLTCISTRREHSVRSYILLQCHRYTELRQRTGQTRRSPALSCRDERHETLTRKKNKNKDATQYILTHSLTAALDQLRVVASSTSNDPGPRSRQHQQYIHRLIYYHRLYSG